MNDLIVFALKAEAPSIFQYSNVFEIGVGKVNAAINTAMLINIYHPKRIINLGTAGGVKLEKGIYRVNHTFQHDVNLTSLGLEPGQILGDNHCFIDLPGHGYTCATGDMHVTEKHKMRLDCDMVDMECFSIAKTCLKNKVECEIWKYISDQADENAGVTWQEEVASGEEMYKRVLAELQVNLLGG
jgi:adenosylhomocysteine nucleosidase